MTVRALGPAVVVAVALLLVPGCGSDDEPTRLPPASASTPTPTSGSPSPTASKSGKVDAATKASAERFVRRFFATYNRARDEGRYKQVRNLYVPSCALCERLVHNVERFTSRGQTVEGGHLRVLSATFDSKPATAVLVRIRTFTAAARVTSRSGRTTAEFPASGRVDGVVNLVRRPHAGWVIQDLVSFGRASS